VVRGSLLRPLLVDGGVAGLCVLAFWLPFRDQPGCPLPLHIALPVLLAAGLLVRSRVPVVSFWLVVVSTLTGAILGVTTDPFTAAAWTLCSVTAVRRERRLSSAVSVLLGVAIVALILAGAPDLPNMRYALLSVVLLTGGWRLGAALRQARTEAEHAARTENQRALMAERLHMAREIHDVVSHSLATIAVTAGVGARAGSDPERLRPKLLQIEQISRHALVDLRSVLGVVRDGDTAAERGPQPGVESLPDLIDRAGRAGVPAELVMRGVADVPPGIGLAIFRIAQVGLTNAIRYAVGKPCRVTVTGTGSEVRVDVVDGGDVALTSSVSSPASTYGGGYGLLGLRERVESLGGEFSAGPGADGGFAIRATIPLPPPRGPA
jgi:signal transduction histidine kinase